MLIATAPAPTEGEGSGVQQQQQQEVTRNVSPGAKQLPHALSIGGVIVPGVASKSKAKNRVLMVGSAAAAAAAAVPALPSHQQTVRSCCAVQAFVLLFWVHCGNTVVRNTPAQPCHQQ